MSIRTFPRDAVLRRCASRADKPNVITRTIAIRFPSFSVSRMSRHYLPHLTAASHRRFSQVDTDPERGNAHCTTISTRKATPLHSSDHTPRRHMQRLLLPNTNVGVFAAHENNVFGVRFLPSDPFALYPSTEDLLVTGGLDRLISLNHIGRKSAM